MWTGAMALWKEKKTADRQCVRQLFFDMLILAIDEIQADHTDQDTCCFTGRQSLVVQKDSDEQERYGKE